MLSRRKFGTVITLGTIGCIAPLPLNAFVPYKNKQVKPLKKGDTIGLIAPAFRIGKNRLDMAKANLKKLSFKCYHTQNILKRKGYLAGNDSTRLEEIHHMFSNESVDGIWCVEGSYGTTRILDQLNFELIKQNPKPIIGFYTLIAGFLMRVAVFMHILSIVQLNYLFETDERVKEPVKSV